MPFGQGELKKKGHSSDYNVDEYYLLGHQLKILLEKHYYLILNQHFVEVQSHLNLVNELMKTDYENLYRIKRT